MNPTRMISASKEPHEYLNELLALGDARYQLGQYDQAGGIFYRAYYATMHDPKHGNVMNNPSIYPVAHKMIQAWSKSESEYYLKMAHSMAEQTTMMPGCPAYIRHDMDEAAKAMRMKGMKVESLRDAFGKFAW